MCVFVLVVAEKIGEKIYSLIKEFNKIRRWRIVV